MNERYQGEQESPIEARLAAPPISQDQIPAAAPASSATAAELIQKRGVVLAILFFVTGALGIPLLWINRNFSDAERIAWSIIVSIYTLILLWITYAIVMWSWRQIVG